MKNLKHLWDTAPEMLDGIGGEQLTGSDFESERPDIEFATQESGEAGEE